jgi:hypothetical protein
LRAKVSLLIYENTCNPSNIQLTGRLLLELETSDFINDRVLKVRASMPHYVLILIIQPWVMNAIEESMDFIDHAAK